MSSQQHEIIPFLAAVFFPVFVFLISPSYLSESSLFLNRFMDDYLLGNGYYLPSNYPFAAKITNNFSVVFAVVSALVWGLLRLKYHAEYIIPDKKQFLKYSFFIVCVSIFFLYQSIVPQEFSPPKTRNWMLTESFHNIPACFLLLMISKNMFIYLSIRFPLMLFKSRKA